MSDDRVDAAADSLYAADPDEFMKLRKTLADEARRSGDPEAAKQITALRKPTASAAIVNRLAHADAKAMKRLRDLGEKLRAAQDALDAGALRKLTAERRRAVADLTDRAVEVSDGTPSQAVRDEVRATIEAAIADPDVAGRLGRLQKAERWSGFGFDAGPGPTLTLVRGGKDAQAEQRERKPAKKAAPAERRTPPAERRRLQRNLDRAQGEFDQADAEVTELEESERAVQELVRRLTAQLAEVQKHLEDEKRHLEDARRQLKRARTVRREARSALDRATRQVDRIE